MLFLTFIDNNFYAFLILYAQATYLKDLSYLLIPNGTRRKVGLQIMKFL
jgi:hypothetical protein